MSTPKDKEAAEPKKYLDYDVWKTAAEWAKDQRCLVGLATLEARLAKGWTLRHAMTVCLTPGE
jgi:hypothetical protein